MRTFNAIETTCEASVSSSINMTALLSRRVFCYTFDCFKDIFNARKRK